MQLKNFFFVFPLEQKKILFYLRVTSPGHFNNSDLSETAYTHPPPPPAPSPPLTWNPLVSILPQAASAASGGNDLERGDTTAESTCWGHQSELTEDREKGLFPVSLKFALFLACLIGSLTGLKKLQPKENQWRFLKMRLTFLEILYVVLKLLQLCRSFRIRFL